MYSTEKNYLSHILYESVALIILRAAVIFLKRNHYRGISNHRTAKQRAQKSGLKWCLGQKI